MLPQTRCGGQLSYRGMIGDRIASPYDSSPNMTLGVAGFPSSEVMHFPRTDTANDFMTVANDPRYMGQNIPRTWGCWVKVEDTSQARYAILGRDADYNSGIGIAFEGGIARKFRPWQSIWTSGPLDSVQRDYDVWYQVFCTCEGVGGAHILYVNGVRSAVVASAGADDHGTVNLAIGAASYNNRLLTGSIFDVRWYDRVLSDGEIWGLYDPTTRWDLYEEFGRNIQVAAAGEAPPPSGLPAGSLSLLGAGV